MMAKPGDVYLAAVTEVARGIFTDARVVAGDWVEGLDGERDLDVTVYQPGHEHPALFIECKDHKRPVGIGMIDALESKRRD